MRKLRNKISQIFNKKNSRMPKNNRLSEAELNELKSTIIEIELRDK